MAKKRKPIAALDIGTHRTCALIAEMREDGALDVIGAGSVRSEGVRKGSIVNLERAVAGIRRAVEEAELMSGAAVDRVYVGVNGGHLKGVNSRGVVATANRQQGVSESDVRRVIDSARAIPIPSDRDIVHVIPQEFVVDDQDGIGDPLGMTGARLEASVHIVTASRTAVQNVETCVNRAGYEVVQMVAGPLAASESALTHDEKELGAGLLDVGGGTTGIVLFERGSPIHTAVVPLGSDNITSDISIGLRCSIEEAEKIKKRHGCALTSLVGEDETLEVAGIGRAKARVVSRRLLSDIIQHRVDELFRLVAEEIHQGGFERALNAGYVLTGGGSPLEGMLEVAESILGAAVRPGAPQGPIGGLTDVVKSPEYAAGVGLLLYAKAEEQKHAGSGFFPFLRAGEKMRGWFKGWF